MKSLLGKLSGFRLQMNGRKEEEQHNPAKLDELAEAARDMQEIRSFYESIQSAAATTANNAYELSMAFEELGSCLFERIEMNDNEDSGRALKMIGQAQYDLQRHLDGYRAHIFQTMANPSRSLLRQLEIVEDMKFQCDEKREFYKNMLFAYKEKRSRLAKGGKFSSKKLRQAETDYEEAAALFVFRLKSLKQGQFRSLLTQAARHHAAQLSFFRKGLKTLEEVDSQVKVVAEEQHIDYQFSDLKDDDDGFSSYDSEDADAVDDFDNIYANDVRDATSAYKQSHKGQDAMPKVSVEALFADGSNERLQEARKNHEYADKRDLRSTERRPNYGSQSAPIFTDKKVDQYERIKEARLSYVLPVPPDHRNPVSTSPEIYAFSEKKSEQPKQLRHSSPSETEEPLKLLKQYKASILESPSRTSSLLKEDATKSGPIITFSSSPEQLSALQTKSYSSRKSFKRQAFSGPLSSMSFPSRPKFNETDYGSFVGNPQVVPSVTKHASVHSRKSPPPTSSVRISELHELPKPPTDSEKMMKPSSFNGYSGPLVFKRRLLPATNITMDVSYKTSPLPTPLASVTRSFSTPSSSQKKPKFDLAIMEDSSKNLDPVDGGVSSSRIVPISLTTTRPVSTNSLLVQFQQILS